MSVYVDMNMVIGLCVSHNYVLLKHITVTCVNYAYTHKHMHENKRTTIHSNTRTHIVY